MFYFLLLTKAVYISLPTENKYLDGTSTFFLRAGELSMADSIDFYPTKDNYKKIKLNLRGSKDFLTVNNNSKIIEVEEFNNEDNQNFELIIDVSGYIRIMYRSLCVEYMERKNYLLLRRCSRSAKQLFDLIAEKSVNKPTKSLKRSSKTLNRFMNRELLTTNFGYDI
ncbi:hypothetical protein TUBRATIS_10400 [Tubulinosema ratisbonensis]|uniref:Uncharacterized protein n=1 Tax=Tubulinosema ratisbonensis TaxID=291195 RepID=A0A437AN92_9MICR|nr:hypothetical protein TUBRATIS_10400 [Tubulinosema ratisbonensis]